ncbi:MAG: ATP-dependent DNA helicase RecQ [Treponema sp.]|nr:MAG: ATP-dependent DNA helicase RecQ [Treponema sp.]
MQIRKFFRTKLTGRLKEYGISHIAIDEAHCVSEWGDTFRPAYLELGKILRTLDVPVVTAFTATASPEVLARISDVLFNGEAHIVRSESDRPNIHYYVKKVASKKAAALVLAKTEARPMIIFCGTRSRTEDMAQELNTAFGAETAKFYHAGMERGEKTKIEEWFFSRKDAVLCATCAYGMGVDKKDIHTVVHLDPPQTAEAYIQEAGRGGRDGSVANAILLWNFEDSLRFAEFPSGSRKAALREFAGTKSCRRQVLLDALGAEQAVCSGCDICRGKAFLKTDSYRHEKNSESKTSGKKSLRCSGESGISSRFYENFPVRIKIAQKISDFHKVSSRHFVEKDMPSGNVADDEEIAFRLIELSEKYFTRESFEKFYTKFMNRITIPFTGVNIWNHENFCLVMESLLSSKKIEICGWPWKGRLKIREKPENHDKKEKQRRFSRKIRFFRIPRIAFFIFRRKTCHLRRRIEKMTPIFLSVP